MRSFRCYDKNSKILGDIRFVSSANTTQDQVTQIIARRGISGSEVSSYIATGVRKDGTTYSITGNTPLVTKNNNEIATTAYVCNKLNTFPEVITSNTEWHVLYTNGWCEQGGYLYHSGNSKGVTATLTLPIPYKDNNYGIWIWAGVGNSGWQYAGGVILGTAGNPNNTREKFVTTTGFTFANATGVSGTPIYWRTAGLTR